MVFAPSQLPFVPRPLSCELISSWLLRVAAANHVPLADLLDGFESQYPKIWEPGELIDCSLSSSACDALAQFCRVPVKTLRALDLRQRVPNLNPALLLRFSKASHICPRRSYQRVRYAFCPVCLFTDPVTHIRWDWSLACLVRCSIHRVRLRDGCEICGDSDPLTFSAPNAPPNPPVGPVVTSFPIESGERESDGHIEAVEHAYRSAPLGVAPHPAPCGPFDVSRRDILTIIAELIRNAAPSSDVRLRRFLNSRSSELWSTLLELIPEHEGESLDRTSQHWPLSLRRRFAAGLRDRTKKRWPYTPYGGLQNSKQFKYNAVVSVSALSTQKPVKRPLLHI
jgi:TniQ